MRIRIASLIASLLFVVSCENQTPFVFDKGDDPADMIAAVYRVEDGEGVICVGKLHSHHFRKLCNGDYPSVSPSGRFVAHNRSVRAGIQTVRVIEIQTGKVTTFNSIPEGTAPRPESFWSKDERLIAFHVNDFNGNRGRCVVSLTDGSFWRGTNAEFAYQYPNVFRSIVLDARRSVEGRLTIENFKDVGALFYHPSNEKMIRLTPEDMAVGNPPIWIERTGEALFVGSRVPPGEGGVGSAAIPKGAS